MLVIAAAGVWSYLRLGRSEDPDFTVKTMVVQAAWPGATVADTLGQVTDRIESKLQETPKHFVYSPRSDFSTKSRSGSSATLMCDI
jgi:multidrug efflux pump subunit AcrB